MKIVTSAKAKQQLRGTVRYIQREFGRKSAENFVQKVKETKMLLARNPYLGPIEPLLAELPTTYRSIVVARQNKMVYRITDDRIEIADFWDVRKEPAALADSVK